LNHRLPEKTEKKKPLGGDFNEDIPIFHADEYRKAEMLITS
jgi:hypothetical protein